MKPQNEKQTVYIDEFAEPIGFCTVCGVEIFTIHFHFSIKDIKFYKVAQ